MWLKNNRPAYVTTNDKIVKDKRRMPMPCVPLNLLMFNARISLHTTVIGTASRPSIPCVISESYYLGTTPSSVVIFFDFLAHGLG
ncbi:hypothetical protein HNY73_006102 [Argiope bruennichi]|uniref:Uncharacterized protein n=1 Tax=Argiope bruennichi TaxID=94029 RepID=A0A8T0FLT5_ARGBR|nr:hypothetical protein HNY73_006102 [Argiope bruennichi]